MRGTKDARAGRARPWHGWTRTTTTLVAAVTVAVAGVIAGGVAAIATTGAAASPTGHRNQVLLVGTYDGHHGQFSTIQAALNVAQPTDWILVAPGDYKVGTNEAGPTPAQASDGDFGGLLVTTKNIHIRGMNRNSVIVDGTKAGAPACSPAAGDQNFGANAAGRNGIVVYRANGVSIDNLTACNFMAGNGSSGNQIWWNGVSGLGTIGLSRYEGSYLTATSTYFGGEATAPAYGIFSSNATNGSWDNVYASNMNDSGSYIGACRSYCNALVNHAWMENNALGYSGTNSGGRIVIENSQFDDNQDGLDTNTQIAGDPPAPQDGRCRASDGNNGISPVTGTTSCWVVINNDFHDNNNPDAPAAGSAAAGPIGTGMTISGGHSDTVMDNTFANNGAWGILFVPYPDSGNPSAYRGHAQVCKNVTGTEIAGFGCVFNPEGDALLNNTFTNNGSFGNITNGAFGMITLPGRTASQNCFNGNTGDLSVVGGAGVITPTYLEQTQPTCVPRTKKADTGGPLLGQVLCDTGFGGCPPGANYPAPGTVVLKPLPTTLASMPNPCEGVPTNAWCPSSKAS